MIVIKNIVNAVAGISLITCSLLGFKVGQLSKKAEQLEEQKKDIHDNIRKTLGETVITFSRDGAITTRKIPVGSSLHVILSANRLINIEVEMDKPDPETDKRYASLFK